MAAGAARTRPPAAWAISTRASVCVAVSSGGGGAATRSATVVAGPPPSVYPSSAAQRTKDAPL